MKLEQVILKIDVFDIENRRVTTATVDVTDEKNETTAVKLDETKGMFEVALKAPGHYSIQVTHREYESQTRHVKVNTGKHEEVFILGRKGMPFYYRGRVKVPFEPLPDYLGVVIREPLSADRYFPQLEALAKEYELERIEGRDNLLRNGLYIYRIPPATPDSTRDAIQESFRKQEFVFLCAPLVKLFEKNASLLTDSIIARFKGEVTQDQITAISRELGLEIVRSIPYAGNAYQFRAKGPISYRLLGICERLVETDMVEYAEPDLWHTTEDDQINPTDWLFPEQWDHQIIGMPNAWQALANMNAANTFGAPDIVIAVVDSGIDAAHPAFAGNVSSGAAKVYQLFDFVNMAANNNALQSDHGTCCAGAATGRANDASAVAGVNEGTAGIVGNCRVIGIRRGGPETTYADMYVWTAGFDPNSALANFPAQINPGADIITNSFGFSVGSPISGLMRDTFDFLTTYGRGGKGVLIFCSVGNFVPRREFTLERPWAAYDKTMAVGASTLMNDGVTEGISQYSGFGPSLDFCAPSHDEYVNDLPLHNPPVNYGAFTPTIRNTPTSGGGNANTPGRPTIQTTLTVNTVAGSNTLTVANIAGLAVGQGVLVGNPGAPGTEAHVITAINVAQSRLTIRPALFNNHPTGTIVSASQADYRNNFGGTSYATPVCAGVAAAMLSANKNLTWIEIRELLQATAVKIDPNNTDATGRWRDQANRISTDPGYAGPFFSQWYGYGRINAAQAVEAAANYGFQRDIVVRDNLADTGLVPSTGVFWEGVDIWVRNTNDNVAPANYATHANTVHQDPIFGQTNWVYVRFRNIGTLPSFPFFVRIYLTHWAGTEFVYPDNFIPNVRPNDPLPSPLTPGTYLIGEATVASLAAQADGCVAVEWPARLIPPQTVTVAETNVTWHPCLLVEVTPHDGFTPTGTHVWQNNNLAQKNISIVYPDSSSGDFAFAGVVGNLKNQSKFIGFEIWVKWPIPYPSPLYVRFLNRHVETFLVKELEHRRRRNVKAERSKEGIRFYLVGNRPVRLQLPNVGPCAFIIGGNVQSLSKGDKVSVQVLQFDDNGWASGGLSFDVVGLGK